MSDNESDSAKSEQYTWSYRENIKNRKSRKKKYYVTFFVIFVIAFLVAGTALLATVLFDTGCETENETGEQNGIDTETDVSAAFRENRNGIALYYPNTSDIGGFAGVIALAKINCS